MFSKGVKIFQKVECLFKPRLIADWESESVGVATVLDDKNPSARFVTVPLNQRVGKAILCRFYFADTWMMMSEISFQSGEYSFSQADLVMDREQKRWCGGAGHVGLTWVQGTVGLHDGEEEEVAEALRGLEGQWRGRKIQSTMDAFQVNIDAHAQKNNQGNQKLDYRAFLLFETVACWL